MKSVNKVTLIGNVGRDPEVRYMQSGDPVMNFSLATTETWKDKSGAKQERTEWHRIEVWGKLAEIMKEYIVKGKPVYVEGQIAYDEWTDKDGNKRNATKIKVGFNGNIILLGSGGGGDKATRKPAGSDSGSGAEVPYKATDDDIPF